MPRGWKGALKNRPRATRVEVSSIVASMRRAPVGTPGPNVEASAQDLRPLTTRRAEVKSSTVTAENSQLYHNSFATFVPTWPSQGTAYNQRIGDAIKLRNIKVKLWLSAKLDRPNVNVRVTYVTTTNSAFSGSDLYAGAMTMVAPINNPEVRVLYDKVLKIPTSTYQYTAGTSKEDSIVHWFELPMTVIMGFRRGTTSPNVVHYLYVTAYDAYATLPSDNIASVAYSIEVQYLDE